MLLENTVVMYIKFIFLEITALLICLNEGPEEVLHLFHSKEELKIQLEKTVTILYTKSNNRLKILQIMNLPQLFSYIFNAKYFFSKCK